MKDIILTYIKVNGPVKRKVLLAYLKNMGFKVTDRSMRQAIVELIETDGVLITSSSKGYKLAESVKEYEKAIKYVTSYAMALLKKRRALRRNYDRITSELVIENSKLVTV
jgi:hypothetical protein